MEVLESWVIQPVVEKQRIGIVRDRQKWRLTCRCGHTFEYLSTMKIVEMAMSYPAAVRCPECTKEANREKTGRS